MALAVFAVLGKVPECLMVDFVTVNAVPGTFAVNVMIAAEAIALTAGSALISSDM